MSNARHVVLYIAMSLDGFIAKPNDDLSFLSVVAHETEDYGYSEFIDRVDTVVVGRRTYDWVMKQVPEFPHSDKDVYVVTHTPRESIGNTHFYTGDIEALILRLKSEPTTTHKHIFIDGGAQLVNLLLDKGLIDEIILSVIPILVGCGTRLFNDTRPEQGLTLHSVKSYESGLVQVRYFVG